MHRRTQKCCSMLLPKTSALGDPWRPTPLSRSQRQHSAHPPSQEGNGIIPPTTQGTLSQEKQQLPTPQNSPLPSYWGWGTPKPTHFSHTATAHRCTLAGAPQERTREPSISSSCIVLGPVQSKEPRSHARAQQQTQLAALRPTPHPHPTASRLNQCGVILFH